MESQVDMPRRCRKQSSAPPVHLCVGGQGWPKVASRPAALVQGTAVRCFAMSYTHQYITPHLLHLGCAKLLGARMRCHLPPPLKVMRVSTSGLPVESCVGVRQEDRLSTHPSHPTQHTSIQRAHLSPASPASPPSQPSPSPAQLSYHPDPGPLPHATPAPLQPHHPPALSFYPPGCRSNQ